MTIYIMKISGVLWLQKIIDKIERKHHITQSEVEQVLSNNPQYRFIEKGRIEGENVYSAYGRTDAGRYVTIIFIHKFNSRALIISVRDMDKKENNMEKTIESIPNDMSIEQASEFWDTHSVADYPSHIVEMEFKPEERITFVAVANELLRQLDIKAKENGVSIETLVNLWLQEKLIT